MVKNPKPLPALVYVEIEVSYRWRGSEPACAFVCVVEQRATLHRRVVDSEHLIGSPERLVDLVNDLVRRWTLEYVLAHVEPF